MLTTTLEAGSALLKTDPTLAPNDRRRLLSMWREDASGDKRSSVEPTENSIIRRAEFARRISRSVRFVDRLAADGVIRKVVLPGRVRAAGFRESDVAALIECKETST